MKRDRFDIIVNILDICKNGAKKTNIVYKANLNFRNADGYIQHLIDQELITKEGKCFKTTSKGARLLQNMQGISAILA